MPFAVIVPPDQSSIDVRAERRGLGAQRRRGLVKERLDPTPVESPLTELLDGLEFCGSTVRMLPSITPPLPCTKTFQPRAFATGWALKKASLLDSYCLGFLNHLLFASNTKRQAAFTALAALDPSGPEALAERMREIAPTEC